MLSLQLKITGTASFQIADRPGSGLAFLVVSRITRRLAAGRVACGHADISIRGETGRQSKCRCTVDAFARQRDGTPLRPSAHKGVCIEKALCRFHAHLFGGLERNQRTLGYGNWLVGSYGLLATPIATILTIHNNRNGGLPSAEWGATYAKEMREALERWGDYVAAITK